MSRASKEVLVVLVDVGQHMHKTLEGIEKAVFTLVESKLLFKPAHEVAIIYFGTTDTQNALHDEEEANGEPDQYMHITVQQPLQCTSMDCLQELVELPKGTGSSDWVNALLVALDLLLKALRERSELAKPGLHKSIVLVSNFEAEVAEMDSATSEAIVTNLQSQGVQLEAIAIGNPDVKPSGSRAATLDTLHQLLAEANGSFRTVPEEMAAGMFKLKEVAPAAAYVGAMTIGTGVEIQVKVYKKTAKEKLPSLKMYSDKHEGPEATHEVKRNTEYRLPSDPNVQVPPQELVPAHRYGRDNVPIAREDEAQLKFTCDRAFQIMGFAPADAVPRHLFMKDTSIVVADMKAKDVGSQVAVSALVRALERSKKVAMARFVARNGGAPSVVCLTPQVSTNPAVPDALMLNVLPFAEDYRSFVFPPLDRPDRPHLTATNDQVKAARRLVRAMHLAQPTTSIASQPAAPRQERLRPEETANPLLQRFYYWLGRKLLDPAFPVPESDPLSDATFDPRVEYMAQGAQQAMDAMESLFQTEVPAPKAGAAAAAGADAPQAFVAAPSEEAGPSDAAGIKAEGGMARNVQSVGTTDPVGDFKALLASGQVDAAVQGMQAAVLALVTGSVGGSRYGQAVECCRALRAACVEQGRAGDWNVFVRKLAGSYAGDVQHGGFWTQLVEGGKEQAGLISTTESSSSDVSEAAAAQFLALYSGKEEPVQQAVPMETAGDDELDDMA